MTQDELNLVLDALKWCHGGEPCGTAEAIAVVERALANVATNTWVGLTVEDVHDCLKGLPTQSIEVYARSVEAKLKEKNSAA